MKDELDIPLLPKSLEGGHYSDRTPEARPVPLAGPEAYSPSSSSRTNVISPSWENGLADEGDLRESLEAYDEADLGVESQTEKRTRRLSWRRWTSYRPPSGILEIVAFATITLTISYLLITSLALSSAETGSHASHWIKQEQRVAEGKMLDNIGPGIGAGDGIVIASPSHKEADDLPDYQFTWTRDSALVFSSLHLSWLPLEYLHPYRSLHSGPSTPDTRSSYSHTQLNSSSTLYESLFRAYVASQAVIQNTANPSGDLWTGGLNEPKFQVDGAAFTGDWGRPQRDGPALRALTLIPYANYLLDRAFPPDVDYVKKSLYDPEKIVAPGNVVKNDLEEVAKGWGKGGFDLWEEVNGHHLFTMLVSLRALQAGLALATRLQDTGAADYYRQQSESIGNTIAQFWDEEGGYYRSSLPFSELTFLPGTSADASQQLTERQTDVWPEREWKDCSLPLSIVHAGDVHVRAGSDSESDGASSLRVLDPVDPKVISTVYEYILSFRGLYGINEDREWTEGWALGRYKEDVYDGVGKSAGNPWFICTHSLAHVLYLASSACTQQGYIETHNLTAPFWSDLVEHDVEPGQVWHKGGREFEKAVERLRDVGDAFLRVLRGYWTDEGGMSEQIDRNNGQQVGARDLTWSYASFLSAGRARG